MRGRRRKNQNGHENVRVVLPPVFVFFVSMYFCSIFRSCFSSVCSFLPSDCWPFHWNLAKIQYHPVGTAVFFYLRLRSDCCLGHEQPVWPSKADFTVGVWYGLGYGLVMAVFPMSVFDFFPLTFWWFCVCVCSFDSPLLICLPHFNVSRQPFLSSVFNHHNLSWLIVSSFSSPSLPFSPE